MNIWSLEENENEYKLSNISKKEVEEIERNLQKKIPKSYKDIIYEQNGGFIQYNFVKVKSSSDKNKLEINHIYGLGKGGILDSEYLIREWNLPTEILIFSGDGNSFFALDYRKNLLSPTIIYLETEGEEIIEVADNFKEFLDNLFTEEFLPDLEEDYSSDMSVQEAENIFFGINGILIEETLLNFQYHENKDWYFNILLTLSSHKDLIVRQAVISILTTNIEMYLGDSERYLHDILKEIIDNLILDKDLYIRTEAQELKRRVEES